MCTMRVQSDISICILCNAVQIFCVHVASVQFSLSAKNICSMRINVSATATSRLPNEMRSDICGKLNRKYDNSHSNIHKHIKMYLCALKSKIIEFQTVKLKLEQLSKYKKYESINFITMDKELLHD